MSPSSSSITNNGFRYDVFISFRGEDTRYSFTGYLWKALNDRGVCTFMDDEDLQKGEEITPSLVKAIEHSKIAIIVLSKHYASSSFCLQELSTILRCSNGNGRLVWPVFYKVDPSNVRKLRGTYGEAMAIHEVNSNQNMDRLQEWKEALQQVANLSGFHFKKGDKYEHKFIAEIVERVCREIKPVTLPVADYLVGLESQKRKVTSLLNVGSDDKVHMVGIHGMGGIGKTTLALAVYNLIAHQFEGSCFLKKVREKSEKHGLPYLQKILLSEIVGEKKIELTSVEQGISIIQQRLRQKKFLLLLDDVDKAEQLHAIAGRSDWFGFGSRVIITTRDKHLLSCHGVKSTYEVKELNEEDASKLLKWKAFKTDKVSPSYEGVLSRAVTYASGLPLALEVIGSHLFKKGIEEWESTLCQWERVPNKEILKILKVRFDALEEEEKSVFLDIACCFKGYELAWLKKILSALYGDSKKDYISVLVEKSLIKISKFGEVTLNDMIENMGKEIVRQESVEEPGKRSRLWFHEDITQVLEKNTGTSKIKIICSNSMIEVKWDGEAFKNMENLRTLIINGGPFSESPKHLPNGLRILQWQWYPSSSLPSDFHPKKLAICELTSRNYNSFLWLDLFKKKYENMRILNLDGNGSLIEIPDVSGLPNLEEFSFKYCENLITIDDSVGLLNKLKILSAEFCQKLTSFPPLKLPSLEQLNLSNCCRLDGFPEILGEMENITQLYLEGTPIKELPLSFQNLTRLQTLYLSGCEIVQLPSSIVIMSKLAKLTIEDGGWLFPKEDEGEENLSPMQSSQLDFLHLYKFILSDESFSAGLKWFANVKELYLSESTLRILPKCIKKCPFLWKLVLDNCKELQEIKGIPPSLKTLSALNCISLTSLSKSKLLNQELHEARNTSFLLPHAKIPEWFEHPCIRRSSISFWFRNNFPVIALCVVVSELTWNDILFYLRVIIDGKTFFYMDSELKVKWLETDHLHLFHMQMEKFGDNQALLENKWNHAKIEFGFQFLESGIYVLKKKTSMKDIRFTNPSE